MSSHDQTKSEDWHFYIDNATLREVCAVFRVLSSDMGIPTAGIADVLMSNYGFAMQSDTTYSPRRLFDLGLAIQGREGGKLCYRLSERGQKLQTSLSEPMLFDMLHYLFFTGSVNNRSGRKSLWSYRRCCELTWHSGVALASASLTAAIQEEMKTGFPDIDMSAKQGARFKQDSAASVYNWLRTLEPSPIGKLGEPLIPRQVTHYELALLALDDTYRSRGYRYGDGVLLNDDLLRHVAGVFFIDPACCADLLRTAARISPFVKTADTLAGSSINLMRSYTVEDL